MFKNVIPRPVYLATHIFFNQPSVTLQKLKNHKFLFYLKNKEASYEDFFLPLSVLSHVMNTLCNIFSQNLI